eukprot:2697097-Pleurochrysis_carterae.AAC.5
MRIQDGNGQRGAALKGGQRSLDGSVIQSAEWGKDLLMRGWMKGSGEGLDERRRTMRTSMVPKAVLGRDARRAFCSLLSSHPSAHPYSD